MHQYVLITSTGIEVTTGRSVTEATKGWERLNPTQAIYSVYVHNPFLKRLTPLLVYSSAIIR
jgi:hypothetical protein